MIEHAGSVTARLYRNPVAIVATRLRDEVRACLDRLRGTSLHAAGFFGYDTGHGFEPTLAPLCRPKPPDEPPLLWFGLFDSYEEVDPDTLLPDPASAWAGRPRPCVTQAEHEASVERAIRHRFDRDIYLTNLTFQAEVPVAGAPEAVYAALRSRARAARSALLFTGGHWILSFSPELFSPWRTSASRRGR